VGTEGAAGRHQAFHGSKFIRSSRISTAIPHECLASLPEKHLDGALKMHEFLQAQDRAQVMDEMFRDIQTLSEGANRLSLIRELLAEVDNADDFPGREKARAFLADLSREMKKLIRLNKVV